MVDVKLKLDGFVEINKLPTIWKAEISNGGIMQKTWKIVGLQFLRQQQQYYLHNSTGNGDWPSLSLLGRLIRKKGRRAKSVTIREFFIRTDNMKILRDTGNLFNSLSPARSNSARILKVQPLKVTVGTREKKADKHHYGQESKWPSKGELQKALDANFKRRLPRTGTVTKIKKAGQQGGRREKQNVRVIETGLLKTVTQTRKSIKKLGKGIRKTRKAIKKALSSAKPGQKPNNPSYLRMQRIIEKKANTPFKLPERILLRPPNTSELKELEKLLHKGVRQAEQKVQKFLNKNK